MSVADGISAATGLLGLYQNYKQNKQHSRDAERARNDIQTMLDTYNTGISSLNDQQKTAAEAAAKELIGSLSTADWDSAGKVDFNKDSYDVNDYYDPRRASLVASAGRSAQSSAALSGMGRSLGAAQGIAAAMADTDANLYKDAMSQMNQDRQFDYTVAKDTASQRLEALKNKISSQESIYNINKGIADDYYGNEAQRMATMLQGNISKNSII